MKATISLLCAVMAFFFHCSRLTGGGDEFPNAAVIGAIVDTTGAPVSGTVVRLLPVTYDPVSDAPLPAASIDTTDEAGRYRFSVHKTGEFNVQAFQPGQGKTALINAVPVYEKTVSVPAGILRCPGTVLVTVPAGPAAAGAYIYVPGTLIACPVQPGDRNVSLDSVPPGIIPALLYTPKTGAESLVLRYKIEVPPGDTVAVNRPGWMYSRTVYLNTSSTGAGVATDILHFPVLLRLTRNVFDFSEAAPAGADIRFTKADNTTLPHEIERWDASLGCAEIWVKLDTVFGNNAAQRIVMYWGNFTVSDSSNPSGVFDTAAGYQGVWHLSEKEGAISKDATGNHFDGMPKNMNAASNVPGAVGSAQEFNGVSSYIQMPGTAGGILNFSAGGVYSVSAWAYTDTLNPEYRIIVSKGNYQYSLELMDSCTWEFAERKDKSGWEVTHYPAEKKIWTHVAGVRNGDNQYLYLNGVCADNTIQLLFPGNGRDTTLDVVIGKMAGGNAYFFDGKIDEVRICNTASTADRIKLEYMNQKADDALVVFK